MLWNNQVCHIPNLTYSIFPSGAVTYILPVLILPCLFFRQNMLRKHLMCLCNIFLVEFSQLVGIVYVINLLDVIGQEFYPKPFVFYIRIEFPIVKDYF